VAQESLRPLLVLNRCLPAEPRFSSTARKNLAAASEQYRLRRIHDIRRATERLGQGRSVGA
jgi:hypothetical protein